MLHVLVPLAVGYRVFTLQPPDIQNHFLQPLSFAAGAACFGILAICHLTCRGWKSSKGAFAECQAKYITGNSVSRADAVLAIKDMMDPKKNVYYGTLDHIAAVAALSGILCGMLYMWKKNESNILYVLPIVAVAPLLAASACFGQWIIYVLFHAPRELAIQGGYGKPATTDEEARRIAADQYRSSADALEIATGKLAERLKQSEDTQEKLAALVGTIKNTHHDLVADAAQAAREQRDLLDKTIANCRENIAAAVEEAKQARSTLDAQMAQTAQITVKRVADGIESAFKTASDARSTLDGQIAQTAETTVNRVADGIKSAFEAATQEWSGKAAEMLNSLSGHTATVVDATSTLSAMFSGSSDFMTIVKQTKEASDDCRNLLNTNKAIAQTLPSSITESVKEYATNINAILPELKPLVRKLDSLASATEQHKRLAKKMDKLIEGVHSLVSEMQRHKLAERQSASPPAIVNRNGAAVISREAPALTEAARPHVVGSTNDGPTPSFWRHVVHRLRRPFGR